MNGVPQVTTHLQMETFLPLEGRGVNSNSITYPTKSTSGTFFFLKMKNNTQTPHYKFLPWFYSVND